MALAWVSVTPTPTGVSDTPIELPLEGCMPMLSERGFLPNPGVLFSTHTPLEAPKRNPWSEKVLAWGAFTLRFMERISIWFWFPTLQTEFF